MPFLLTPNGIAPRLPDGVAIYAGGSTEDLAAADLAGATITGHAPTLAITSSGVTAAPGASAIAQTGFAAVPLATAHRWVLPAQGQVAQTGFAPSALATAHKWVLPAASTVSATGFSPTAGLTDHKRALPGSGAVSISGVVPQAVATAHKWAIAGLSGISVSGLVPTAAATAHKWALSGVSGIVATGIAPVSAATAHRWAQSQTAAIDMTGLAASLTADASVVLAPSQSQPVIAGAVPVARLSDHKRVLPVHSDIVVSGLTAAALSPRVSVPGVSAVVMTGGAPAARLSIRAYPALSALTISGLVVLALAPRKALAGLSGIAITGNVPIAAATGHRWARPGAGALTATGQSPILTADASVVLGPSAAAFVITGNLPVALATNHKRALPGVMALSQTGLAGIVINPKSSSPGTGAIAHTGQVAVIAATAGMYARPEAGGLAATGYAPTFIAPQTLWPAQAALGLTGQAPGSQAATSALADTSIMAVDTFGAVVEITEDQFARVAGASAMIAGSEAPFIVLPRGHWPEAADLEITGGGALLLAIIPVALMNFVARPGGEMMGQIVKHPWAEVRVSVDWGPYVTRQQTQVSSSSWIETTALATVLDGAFISNSVASVEIGGGNPASIPVVENRVLFADGSRDVFRVRVQVASLT